MRPAIVTGSASTLLGAEIAHHLGLRPTPCTSQRFPDGELQVRVAPVGEADLYVVQATCPPTDENLIELLFIADSCRYAGAARLTAVLPYLGYARQDRRASPGESLGVKVLGELLASCGFDRVVVLDPHSQVFEEVTEIRVEVVSAWRLLADALRNTVSPDSVVVAPDDGARRLAECYAGELGLDVAVVRKLRLSGAQVSVEEIDGDVAGRPVVVVDDMVSTGATVAAATNALLERGARAEVQLCVVHGLFVGPAVERLHSIPLRRLFVTDSISGPSPPSCETTVVGVAALLAERIRDLCREERLDGSSHGTRLGRT